VVLCYSNINMLATLGCIANDDPHIHIPISLSVLLFAPVVGDSLDGVVTRIGSDHMALLVHGLFNVSIGNTQTPGGRAHKVGETITFTVVNLSVVDSFLSLVGELGDAKAATPVPVHSTVPQTDKGARLQQKRKEKRRRESA